MTGATVDAAPVVRGAGVPFLDLVAQHGPLEEELVGAFRRSLHTAAFVGGSEVAKLEEEFARFVGVSQCAGVSSGTDALRFAILAMGVAPGDEVITVANTFIATSEAISQAGAVVKFVDVDDESLTMSAEALRAAIGPRTVGVVPVHLYGTPAAMDGILAVARERGLWVIEDACQAHGATYRGRTVGSIGDLAAFSFYPGKNLGACGEAGAVTGSDLRAMSLVRQLRDHGQSRKYYHEAEGYNGRLDAIQAAVLRIKLGRLASWNESRRAVAGLYREALEDVAELRLPAESDDASPVYHLFVVRTSERDSLQAHLSALGIGTGLHYPLPLHLQKAYANRGWGAGDLPVSERAAATVLSLPMYAELSACQVDLVAQGIRGFFGR